MFSMVRSTVFRYRPAVIGAAMDISRAKYASDKTWRPLGVVFQPPAIPEVADGHVQAGGEFRERIADHHRGARISNPHSGKTVDEEHHDADAHQLLDNPGRWRSRKPCAGP